MMKKNKQQTKNACIVQCREEKQNLPRKPAKNAKYIVFMPGKNAWPQAAPVLNDEPDFDVIKPTTVDTVFDNTYYAHLLMQRKYFID